MSSYRATYEGDPISLCYLQNLANALQGSGITLLCCIGLPMCDGSGQLFANESSAFAAGYAMGLEAAQTLVPLGVTLVECDNELDAKNGIRTPVQAVQGGVPWDFQNTLFPALRGVINGCMTAVRSVGGPRVQCASNAFTACSAAR